MEFSASDEDCGDEREERGPLLKVIADYFE